jgi:hypothetical protein
VIENSGRPTRSPLAEIRLAAVARMKDLAPAFADGVHVGSERDRTISCHAGEDGTVRGRAKRRVAGVDWWSENVSVRESPGRSKSNADQRSILSCEAAEQISGIPQQKVSKWRGYLKGDRDEYRALLRRPPKRTRTLVLLLPSKPRSAAWWRRQERGPAFLAWAAKHLLNLDRREAIPVEGARRKMAQTAAIKSPRT